MAQTIARERTPAASDFGGLSGVLMNLTVYPLLAAWTLLGILLSPLLFLLWKGLTGWEVGRIARHFIWLYGRGWMAIVSPFVRFRRQGMAGGIRPPAIIVVNHLSFFDTYCMGALPIFDITFAVRSWPFRKLFWYTAFMRRAGYLDVEAMEWEESLDAGRRVLGKGGSLLFFPEGHRSRDGELQRFYSGAFRLAHELGCPVVPLCITGTDRLLAPGRLWLRPTQVHLQALPAVAPDCFADHRELRDYIQEQMAQSLQMMRHDGSPGETC